MTRNAGLAFVRAHIQGIWYLRMQVDMETLLATSACCNTCLSQQVLGPLAGCRGISCSQTESSLIAWGYAIMEHGEHAFVYFPPQGRVYSRAATYVYVALLALESHDMRLLSFLKRCCSR
jgi:hypothetical protein